MEAEGRTYGGMRKPQDCAKNNSENQKSTNLDKFRLGTKRQSHKSVPLVKDEQKDYEVVHKEIK